MEILTDYHKKKLDEAAAYHRFKQSETGQIFSELVNSYRETALRDVQQEASPAILLESVRRLHAANDLIRHIESEIETKIGQVEEVAIELGVDLDGLRIRRDIDG